MLSTVRLQNFRSYEDSGTLHLAKLNIFIGSNNAGKSALLSAVQLAQSSQRTAETPLALESQASFASFQSVVRQHWTPGASRPDSLTLTFSWRASPTRVPAYYARYLGAGGGAIRLKDDEYWAKFRLAEDATDGRAYVASAVYGEGKPGREGARASMFLRRGRRKDRAYSLRGFKAAVVDPLHFVQAIPMGPFHRLPNVDSGQRQVATWLRKLSFYVRQKGYRELVVVLPHRPLPRTVYVLDDPNMTAGDRMLISELMRIWSTNSAEAVELRDRIKATLRSLGVAHDLRIRRPLKRGLKIAEVLVAAKNPRQMVTIADVGYGVSQILPLATNEAHLDNGALIAYQPEMHLHPYAQSRLADVFAGTVKRGNQVFVETHSEHLVLRLQYLIAKGVLPPEDVCVFCVEHVRNASEVRSVRFDRKGKPAVRWPKGFLDTGLSLASELARERIG